MELKDVPEFILRIGNNRYRATFKTETPGKEIIFKLNTHTRISLSTEGHILFTYQKIKYFSYGVFCFPESDMAIFYRKTAILTDKRGFERLSTEEIIGSIRDRKNTGLEMPVSAYDISEKGTKISTDFPLIQKHAYILQLKLDPKVFPFANLQFGSIIFNSICEVENIQMIEGNNEVFYGLRFTEISSESERLIKTFLRDYGLLLENKSIQVEPVQTFSMLHTGEEKTETVPYHTEKPLMQPKKDVTPADIEKKEDAGKRYVDIKKFFERVSGCVKGMTKRGITIFTRFLSVLSRARYILGYSILTLLLLWGIFFSWRCYTRKRAVSDVASIPVFEDRTMQKREKIPPVDEKPVVERENIPIKRMPVPDFIPDVTPDEITSENLVSVIKKNNLPLYSIENTDYISLRSLLKLFRCDEKIGEDRKVVSIPYKGGSIVLWLEKSVMYVYGNRVPMTHPIKKISDEYLVSVEAIEKGVLSPSP